MPNKVEQRLTITLSVISLLADLIALAQLSISVVGGDQISGIVWQLIGVVLIFILGVGLGMIGVRGRKTDSVETVLKVFIWAYLIMACLTYMGIIIQFRQQYSLGSYTAYFFILALQISAFTILRAVSEVKNTVSYAFAFLTMAVLHGLIWLFHLVFIGNEEPMQIVREWIFWFVWTLYAIPIISKGFRSKAKNASFIQD